MKRSFFVQPNEKCGLEFGLSARRFIELFRREVGVSPKTFCRIVRFQGALQRIAVASSPNFVRLALDCGYYDQAHLIHDFKDFTGLTPTAFLEARGEHLNHVPLTEKGQIFTRTALTALAE
jgi:AraC-like DNA-binding protein